MSAVAKAVSPGTERLYRTQWNRTLEHRGDRHLDEPSTLEIRQPRSAGNTMGLSTRPPRRAGHHRACAVSPLPR